MVLQSKAFRNLTVSCPGRLTYSNLEHSENAPTPTLTTETGIAIDDRFLHPMKELAPIVMIEGPRVTEASELHLANAES